MQGCYRHNLCNNEWTYQRCTPIAHAQMLPCGVQQGKWRTWCRLFLSFTQVLCLDLRTHKLQVTLRPVQQTIISVTYLIGLMQLLCSKVDLPRLPLLGKLLFEAPEMRQSFCVRYLPETSQVVVARSASFPLSSVLSHAWRLQSWNLSTAVLHVSVSF